MDISVRALIIVVGVVLFVAIGSVSRQVDRLRERIEELFPEPGDDDPNDDDIAAILEE